MFALRSHLRPGKGRLAALAVTAPLLLLVVACGDEPSNADDPDRPAAAAEGLVATLPDGSRVDLDPTQVECVPSEEDPDVEIVRVFADLEGARLIIEAVPTDGAASFELPLEAGDFESGPKNIRVFVGSLPDVETSSTEEESSGTLELLRASCDPAALELKIDATLGSEFDDGGTVQLQGHLTVTGSE